MKRVFKSGRRAAGILLVCVTITPGASACDATTESPWWTVFTAWFQSGATATADDFNAWLEARIGIPPG